MSQSIAREYWIKVNKYLPVLQIVPGLRMVAICNNLAFGKVDERSDIDLFVVARRGRLFTVRTYVTFLLHVLGVRRHDEKVAGRFCLSFFVDDSALNLNSIAIEDDVYLAYWTKSMLPVIDDGVSRDFVEANKWIGEFFNDQMFELSREHLFKRSMFCSALVFVYTWTIDLIFGALIEFVLKKWQLKRARKKAAVASSEASLLISDHILKFHNIDRRKMYRGRWREKFGDAKLSTEEFLLL